MICGTPPALFLSGSSRPYPGASVVIDHIGSKTNGQPYYRINGAETCNLASLPGLTVTRASSGYAETSSGLLVPFAAGVARNTDKGLLVEEARMNLLLQSQALGATWTAGNVTVSSGVAVGPDGTTTADKLAEDNTNNLHRVTQTVTKAASAIQYTFSAYIKAGERSQIELMLDEAAANNVSATFDASTGTIITAAAAAGSFTGASATIQKLPNGWYRATLTGTSNTATTVRAQARLVVSGSTTYVGTTGSGAHLWGGQLEAASFASPYIPTTTASVTRAADAVSLGGLSITGPTLTVVASLVAPINQPQLGRAVSFTDGSDNKFQIGLNTNNIGSVTGAGLTTTDIGSAITAGQTLTIAANLTGGASRASANGSAAAAVTGTSTAGTLTTLYLGNQSALDRAINGYLRRLVIYPSAYSDAQLQALTQ